MNKTYKIGDYLGIFSAIICILHCLAVPLLFTLLNLNFALESNVFNLEIVLVLTSGFAVFMTSLRLNNLKKIIVYGLFSLLVAAMIVHETSETFSEVIGYIASFGLLLFHTLNIKSHTKTGENCTHQRCNP